MSVEKELLEVIVKYQGMEVKFSGTSDEVIRLFLNFMSKIFPNYDLISRVTLSVDLEDLLKNLESIIAITPEGVITTVSHEKAGDREMILLHLIKTNIAYQLNRSEKESASISELMKVTGGKPSSTAARLSELVDMGWVDRVGRGEYRVTTFGTVSFVETSLPKIKSIIAE
jgi:hypothetical protein